MRLASRGAFTLIELMVSITILAVMMLFLYKSYASLNLSNEILKEEVVTIVDIEKLKKVIYLDFLLAINKSVDVLRKDKKEDATFLQSSNSLHKRINPYIAYLVKDEKLYRLESLKRFTTYDLAIDSEFDVDCLGEVESFKVYKSSNIKKEAYLIHVDFRELDDVLLQVKVLGSF